MVNETSAILHQYYEGHQLVPGFYHKWHQAIHIETPYDHELTYQIIEDVQSLLFENEDELFIVANSYPGFGDKTIS